MTQNIDIERILDKIRKLLRMAADTSSPNEAATAAGQARKLMDKYQVSLDDLKESNGFGFGCVDKSYRFVPRWKNFLAVAIGKFNDCKVSFKHELKEINNSYSMRIMFQGFESDVAVATAMYDYLTSAIDRLCAKYMSELGHGKYIARIGDEYKRGAATELCHRLAAMQKEREQQTTTIGTSLVIYKMAQVEAEFGKARYSAVSSRKVASRHDMDAFTARARGREDGANIGLDPQVQGSKVSGKLDV